MKSRIQIQPALANHWCILDVLNLKIIGEIKLIESNLSISIQPKYRRRWLATEALSIFNELMAENNCSKIQCSIEPHNFAGAALLNHFSDYQLNDSKLVYCWNPSSLNLGWRKLFEKKLSQLNSKFSIESQDLPKYPLAIELEDVEKDLFNRMARLHPQAKKAWFKMKEAAKHKGITIQLISSYRNFNYQKKLIENKLAKGLQLCEILKVNTLPGYSEHHTGCAVDIGNHDKESILETCFEETEAFKWLSQEAYHFGFSMTYPKNNDSSIIYEPWHWCFNPQNNKN